MNKEYKESIKISELKEEEWFEIKEVKRTPNNYNKSFGSILVKTDNWMTFLPNKYAEKINDQDIDNWNKEIGNKYRLYFKVNSGISKKYNKKYYNVDMKIE